METTASHRPQEGHEGAIMITLEVLLTELTALSREDLERWIANEWIRPDPHLDSYVFQEIDIARIRLIQQLRDDLQVNEETLPIVLSLLDQLHDERRRLRQLMSALDRLPEDVRQHIAQYITGQA